MTSPSPLLFNTYYHIYNRGINGENIFVQEKNYSHFLNLYAKYIEPVAETYAFCLLRNHFHLLVRIKSEDEIMQALKVSQPDLASPGQSPSAHGRSGLTEKPFGSSYPSKKFSDFFNAYAKAINAAYGRTGSLFQHPFGRVMVKSGEQLLRVVAYIHQNPQKHGFVPDFREWKFSSYGAILSEQPTHIRRGEVARWFGGTQIYQDAHLERITDQQSQDFAKDDGD